MEAEDYSVLRFTISECAKDITGINVADDIMIVSRLGYTDAAKLNTAVLNCTTSLNKSITALSAIIDKVRMASQNALAYTRSEYDRDWESFCALEITNIKNANVLSCYTKTFYAFCDYVHNNSNKKEPHSLSIGDMTMAETPKQQTPAPAQSQQLFDPTRVITNPQGRAIAEMYGVTDEQAAALKTKAAEVYIDMQKKQISGEDFQQRLDNGLHAMSSHVAQATTDGSALHLDGHFEDKENGTRVSVNIGNTRADKAGGTDYTLKIIGIVAVVVVVAVLLLK